MCMYSIIYVGYAWIGSVSSTYISMIQNITGQTLYIHCTSDILLCYVKTTHPVYSGAMNNSQGLQTIRSTVSIYDDTEQESTSAPWLQLPKCWSYSERSCQPANDKKACTPAHHSTTKHHWWWLLEVLALQDWMMKTIHDVYLSGCL